MKPVLIVLAFTLPLYAFYLESVRRSTLKMNSAAELCSKIARNVARAAPVYSRRDGMVVQKWLPGNLQEADKVLKRCLEMSLQE